MAEYLAIRDGGKTNEEGFTRLLNKLAGSQNKGKVGTGDLAVSQNGTPNMTVNVAVGDIIIPYLNYLFHGWLDAIKNVSVTTADPTNPRIDRTVAYVDLSVVSSTNSNNPGALKIKTVAGTPAGSPVRPNDATVQTSVGAGNPFVDLADLAVSANDTSIVTGDITDKRDLFTMSGGVGGAQFGINGDFAVVNGLTRAWVATRPGTFLAVYANCDTAPAGQAAIFRINKNGSQVTTVTIAAGATSGNTTGLAITFVAGDKFTIDCTQIGTTTPGANGTIAIG